MLQEPVTWHSLLREFAADCMAAFPERQADLLREASALFQFTATARPLRVAPEIERMISLGAHENAAIALLDPDASFILCRERGRMAIASVVLPDLDEPAPACGSTPALALLAANALALLQRTSAWSEETSPRIGQVHPINRH